MAALTNRERSIVQAVCQGMANKEIAKELGIVRILLY
jgi:DNA-binding NarL/FixJ family response regulator